MKRPEMPVVAQEYKDEDTMKVMAFNAIARKDGNTEILINYVFEELQKEGIDTELVQFAGKRTRGCTVWKC